MNPPKLSNVAYVILGFLADEHATPKSGYDIKQLVEISTRFFFAASYGQIYPELKKLSEAGMVVGTDDPTGGRARTTYTITAHGRAAHREWLLQPHARVEMRDEGLLRVFFADTLSKEEKIQKLLDLRAERLANQQELKAIEIPDEAEHDLMPELVLDYGIGLHQYVIDWCDRAIAMIKDN